MMNTKKAATGIAMAFAAASLFAAAPTIASADGHDAQVKCFGVNACKGQNDCKTASNACKGQAACKGEGFKMMTEKACKDAGGTVKE